MNELIHKIAVLKNSLEACEHNATIGPHPDPKVQQWGEQMLKKRFSIDLTEILAIAEKIKQTYSWTEKVTEKDSNSPVGLSSESASQSGLSSQESSGSL